MITEMGKKPFQILFKVRSCGHACLTLVCLFCGPLVKFHSLYIVLRVQCNYTCSFWKFSHLLVIICLQCPDFGFFETNIFVSFFLFFLSHSCAFLHVVHTYMFGFAAITETSQDTCQPGYPWSWRGMELYCGLWLQVAIIRTLTWKFYQHTWIPSNLRCMMGLNMVDSLVFIGASLLLYDNAFICILQHLIKPQDYRTLF